MQIGSHQVLAVEEEGETLVLNLEAEALDVAKMMEVEAVVAVEGVLVPKVATKVRALSNRSHIFSPTPQCQELPICGMLYLLAQVGAVAVADAGGRMGQCRFLRPVIVLHRLLRT